MTGETDLSRLLATLEPRLRPGEVVFVSRPDPAHGSGAIDVPAEALATIVEAEGTTVVVPRHTADALGWAYDFVATWITLEVRSSLAAVGLTAAVSTALAEAGISANVLAAFHHDHVLVPVERAADAIEVLRRLSADAR